MGKKKKLLLVILVSLVLIVILAGVGINITSKPSFCANCHQIKPAVASWEASFHGKIAVSCLDCHAGQGEAQIIKRKIASVKELAIQLTGAPSPYEIKGDVPNERCLACHSGQSGAKKAGKDVTKLAGAVGDIHKNSKLQCAGCHIQSAHGTQNDYKLTIVESDKCVACHTDENKIAAMSKPPEPVANTGG